ncbi:P-loop containing nucleoside triphosphate hydrolase protein [Favolaschia claudopus]|uniref:DNA 3'-5' helicase n=1 Tax=Favolaschia claudopus TaxID=2862362 RepID=A0AAW0DFJ1_9AGAR
MADRDRWRSSSGRRTVSEIVKKLIPQWKNGLHDFQLDLIVRILDGEDLLCCIATGAGKSALSRFQLLFFERCLPIRGLAGNIVRSICLFRAYIDLYRSSELKTLDIPAFAYCQDTVSQARITNRNLSKRFRNARHSTSSASTPSIYEIKPGALSPIQRFRRQLLACSATISICSAHPNERPNTQFIMEPLENGVGGKIFPQLLRYSNSGRKAAVHCRTIDDVLRVFTYLWKSLPPGPHRLRRIQMYHSLRSYEDNAEVLRSLDEDPECQVAIVTVAFANGLNIRSLLDSLLVGFPDDPDEAWQRAGRAGRDPDTEARAVVLYQPKLRTAAERQLDGTLIPVKRNPLRKTNRTTETKPMGHAKALILAEKTCYIAASITATLDCIQAKRRLPCSLCATRNETELDFPAPPLPVGFTLPKFTAPPTEDDIIDKKLRLTKPEREEAEPKLVAFGKTPLVQDWVFSSGYRVRLYSMVQELRTTIISNREKAQKEKTAKQRATRRRSKKKAEYDSESGDGGRHPVPPPPKRTKTALKESTNRPRATKSSTIQSAAPAGKHVENITRTYSAPYRTSGRDRGRSKVLDL